MLVGRAELRPEIACAKTYIDCCESLSFLFSGSFHHSLSIWVAFSPYLFPLPSFSFLLIPDFQCFMIPIFKTRALGVGFSTFGSGQRLSASKLHSHEPRPGIPHFSLFAIRIRSYRCAFSKLTNGLLRVRTRNLSQPNRYRAMAL